MLLMFDAAVSLLLLMAHMLVTFANYMGDLLFDALPVRWIFPDMCNLICCIICHIFITWCC